MVVVMVVIVAMVVVVLVVMMVVVVVMVVVMMKKMVVMVVMVQSVSPVASSIALVQHEFIPLYFNTCCSYVEYCLEFIAFMEYAVWIDHIGRPYSVHKIS